MTKAFHTQGLTPRSRQAGAATLAMSVVLLLLITMVSIYTSRTVIMEKRISANDFRARQAFEAAESGLQIAIAYIAESGGADKDGDGNIDPVFDTDADGVGNVNTMTFADNSSVTVTVAGAFPQFQIQSVGVSDDRTATQTVRSIGSTTDALPNVPDNPLTTKSALTTVGSATIHNPEGHSTIWSGSDVDLGSNNSTATNIANPDDPGYPTCMDTSMTCSTVRSSSKIAVGLDVIEHDSSLNNLTAEQMFQNTFGLSMANYRESRVTLEVLAANADNLASNDAAPGVDLATGEVIWVEGNTSIIDNTIVGCEVTTNPCPDANLDPSILIINGDLTMIIGSPRFYGIVFVVGSVSIDGNTTITGALLVNGNVTSTTDGSLDLWYSSDMLQRSRDNGPMAGAPGSWQDW